MNILPKKSWHVRNKDNIEKVRKDEAKAREEERQEEIRRSKAEQEARTNFLRAKSRKALNHDDKKQPKEQHLQLQLFSPHDVSTKNADHQAEEKAEKERHEKKLGILTYLGQSSVELKNQVDRPWYFHKPKRHDEDGAGAKEVDTKRKNSLDPLLDMKRHKKHHHKQEKEKRKKCKKEKSSKQSIEKLRKARLEREAKEKTRRDKLLNGDKTIVNVAVDSYDERQATYNNQFNPHLCKKRSKH